MINNIQKQKALLRVDMLEKRRLLGPAEKKQFEKLIVDQLIELVVLRNIRVVHTYLPMGQELNHTAFIEYCLSQGLTVVTTQTLKKPELRHIVLNDLNDLENGVFGTRHPRNGVDWKGQYDLIIVPGLAFDGNGNRLGYGGGYYDNFLVNHPNAYKVALAFPFQMLDTMPVLEHDQQVDLVISQ